MKNWRRVLSRILISAVLSTLICLLFIEKQYPYTGSLAHSKPFIHTNQTDYFDLNEDGKTERISYTMKVPNLTSVLVYEWDDGLIDQINLRGSPLKRSRLHTGDYNGDHHSEIYLFTHIADTLFLNVLDPYSLDDNKILKTARIDGCRMINGEPWYTVTGTQMADMNGDGMLEFYFSVVAGFTLSPRNLFCYDLVNDTIYRSPHAGAGPRGFLRSHDLDRDGSPEMWGRVSAFGNIKDSLTPYSDKSAWLMVFSHELDFEFEPIEFPGFGSMVDAQVMETNNEQILVVLKTYKGNLDTLHNEILLVDPRGNIIKQKRFPGQIANNTPFFYIQKMQIFVHDFNGNLYVFDKDLELLNILEREWFKAEIAGGCSFPMQSESLFYVTKDGYLCITDMDQNVLAKVAINISPAALVSIASISNQKIPNGIHLRTDSNELTIALVQNPRRNFIYYYWLSIFTTILVFIYLIQILQIRQEKKKQEIEKRLRTLQLQSLKSQMNPHFIFNALNSISAMYMKGNTLKAEKFLNRFSRMIREVVDSSDRVFVTLAEEMEFVRNYLELEKIRYGDNFSYSIHIPDDCKGTELPSMCIHSFAENSVKHAFPDKKKLMKIEIKATRRERMLKIEIRDNGVGFGNAENPDDRKGRGMQIISEILQSYTKASGKKIHYTSQNIGSEEKPPEGSLINLFIEK